MKYIDVMITLENNLRRLTRGKYRIITSYSGVKNPTEKLEVMAITSPTPYIGPYKGWKLIEKRKEVEEAIEGQEEVHWVALFYRMVGKPTTYQIVKFYFKRLRDFPREVREIFEKGTND